MRVCLFTDADVFAGTERHMLDLAIGLRNEGMNVRLAAPEPSVLQEKARAQCLPYTPIQKQGLADRAAVRTLCRLLKSGEVDIIHAHNGRTKLLAAMAVRAAGKGACVATQHFLEPNHTTQRGGKARLSRLAHRWANRHVDQVIAISEAARRAMLARREMAAPKITVVPHGIAAPDISLLPSARQIRAELDILPEMPLILCVARLQREKDIPSLVTAMRSVAQKHPSARCLIAGEGTEREAICRQIEHDRLEGSVRLLGFRDDVPALIRAADVVVLPSLVEGFGLVLVEAMALQKPVIATRAGGPTEIIVEGTTGLLVPPAAPEALAEALCALLADPQRAERMGKCGYERFLERFTTDTMCKATLSVYRRSLGR